MSENVDAAAPEPSRRVKEAWDSVRRFLASGPQPGSVISAYLSTTADFHPREHGFASLTEFLRALGPDLHIVSYAGTDRIWQYRRFTKPHRPRSKLGQEVWRALASPNSEKQVRVYVHTGDGRWMLRSPSGQPRDAGAVEDDSQLVLTAPGEWHQIKPMPAKKHARAAKGFAKREDIGALGAVLSATLELPNWWETWRSLLEHRPELLQSWSDAREKELRVYLREQLREAGLKDDALEAAAAVAGPPDSADTADGSRSREEGPTSHEGSTASRTEREKASVRDFVSAVIAHMTDDELRALSLPARAVYEAAKKRSV
jgi:hypothetical protein